jgi:hypothetical protein
VLPEQLAIQEQRVLLVSKAQQVRQVFKVQQVQLETQDQQDQQDLLVLLVPPAFRVTLAQLVLLVPKEQQARLVSVLLARLAFKA